MYKFVTDKVYLKESYRICAGMVNQLVQNLKGRGIQARMAVAGSKKRGLVTQNEREAIDYENPSMKYWSGMTGKHAMIPHQLLRQKKYSWRREIRRHFALIFVL